MCYGLLLEDYEHLIPKCYKSVIDVLYDFPNEVLLIRIKGHLTCAIKGIVYDTWNCLTKEVTDIWIIDEAYMRI